MQGLDLRYPTFAKAQSFKGFDFFCKDQNPQAEAYATQTCFILLSLAWKAAGAEMFRWVQFAEHPRCQRPFL
jgi:hypothetical protein